MGEDWWRWLLGDEQWGWKERCLSGWVVLKETTGWCEEVGWCLESHWPQQEQRRTQSENSGRWWLETKGLESNWCWRKGFSVWYFVMVWALPPSEDLMEALRSTLKLDPLQTEFTSCGAEFTHPVKPTGTPGGAAGSFPRREGAGRWGDSGAELGTLRSFLGALASFSHSRPRFPLSLGLFPFYRQRD